MTKYLNLLGAASLLALASVSVVHAQETTGGIKGSVNSEKGAPIAGATVTVYS